VILHLDPLVRVVAATALTLHIGGASLGMLSGATALIARKGGRVHRVAGNVFFVSMLTMSSIAAVVAPMIPDRISAIMGVFTFYLTATAWAVVWRRPASAGRFEIGAGLGALAIGATGLTIGLISAQAPGGLIDGEPGQIGFVLAGVATLAALSDFRVVRRGGLTGAPRIARHLWRMCAALFIALGSAAAQPKVVHLLPKFVGGSSLLLMAPGLAVLALMVFWLIRVRFPGWWKPRAAAPQPLAIGV
jgi:uncharacterized membrane protein